MKKRVLGSGVTAMMITAVLCGINWVRANVTGWMWGIDIWGGEYGERRGFGVVMATTYPMSTPEAPVAQTTHIYIDPISLVFNMLVFFVFVLIGWTLIEKLRKKKQEKL